MSQLFAWGGQSIGVSVLASVLPKNTQNWSPLEWTGWISLQSKGLSRVFSNTQFKSINSSVLSFLHSPTLTSIHLSFSSLSCMNCAQLGFLEAGWLVMVQNTVQNSCLLLSQTLKEICKNIKQFSLSCFGNIFVSPKKITNATCIKMYAFFVFNWMNIWKFCFHF